MKARDLFAVLGNRGAERQGNDALIPASPRRLRGSGAPAARRLLAALGVFALVLILGVSLAAADALPSLGEEAAPEVNITTAELTGKVNPNGAPGEPSNTTWRLQFAPQGTDHGGDGNEGWSTAGEGLIAEADGSEAGDPVAVEATAGLGGELRAEATYEFRLQAESGAGQVASGAPYPTFTTDAAVEPVLTAPVVEDLAASTAHLEATVDPEGGNEDPLAGVLPIHWEFELSGDGGANWSSAGSGDLGEPQSANPVSVEADPSGLVPNTNYKVRLFAIYAGLSKASGETAFQTPAIKPDVATATATEGTATSIVLNGSVNPHNSPLTECRFIYGIAGSLDHSAPCSAPLPSGEGAAPVSAAITGLSPATSYSFKLLAANAVGPSESDAASFGTLQIGVAAGCPNDAIRQSQHSTLLGECRAWEMVSPVDKNGNEVGAEGVAAFSSTSGDAFVYNAATSFAETVGSGRAGWSTYLARRDSDGWQNHSITPQPRTQTAQALFGGTSTKAFSNDLSRALTVGYDLPGAADSTPERQNLYLEDTATRGLQTISRSQRGNGEDPAQYPPLELIDGEPLWGASADLGHVAWVTAFQLLPSGVAPGYYEASEPSKPEGQNVYTWDEGTIHLAGILPDGTVPPEGSRVSPLSQGFRGTMSADGRLQTFVASPSAGAPAQLYVRIEHDRTAWVSEPEVTQAENPAFKELPEGIVFQGMTPDGHDLFFVSESPLLAADTAPGFDLYRWTAGPDPAHESNLTLITDTGDASPSSQGFGDALIGMSDDGTRVYVTESSDTLRVWDDGVSTVIDNVPRVASEGKYQLTLTTANPGGARVSPDGNWLAYINYQVDKQMYLYNFTTDTQVCVSCSPSGKPVDVVPAMGGNKFEDVGGRPRFLSDDGSVFFSTAAPLLPQDFNGVSDAYEFDGATGQLHLISSGRGSDAAMFADASPSGDDVFFATRQSLVRSDTDGSALDFYDARRYGGRPEPEAPAPNCAAESCQPPSGTPPSSSLAASSALGGGGNVKPPRHCGKNRHRVRRGGKSRCVKLKTHAKHRKTHAKHRKANPRNQRADSNRRAGR